MSLYRDYSNDAHQKLLVVSMNRCDIEMAEIKSVDAEWLNANSVVIHVVAPLWVVQDAVADKPEA